MGGPKWDDSVLTREVARNTPDRQGSSVENTEARGTGQRPSTSPFGESSSVQESRRIAALQCAQNRPPQSPARIVSYIYTVLTFSPLRWVRSSALGDQIRACQFHTLELELISAEAGRRIRESRPSLRETNWGRASIGTNKIVWSSCVEWLVGDSLDFLGRVLHERSDGPFPRVERWPGRVGLMMIRPPVMTADFACLYLY